MRLSLLNCLASRSCCFLGVSAGSSLKPAADSKSELLLVVAQPTVSASRAVTVIILNETICFIILGCFQVCGCLGDDFISKREFAQELSQFSRTLPMRP